MKTRTYWECAKNANAKCPARLVTFENRALICNKIHNHKPRKNQPVDLPSKIFWVSYKGNDNYY